MFRDSYTDFYYNDVHSKYYSVWITNNKDLTMNLSPNFSDKFVSPTYTQQRFYEGTTIDKQDLKLNMVAVNVTQSEWRAISQWLSPTTAGRFSFGWNKSHYYMVKPTNAPSGTIFIRNSHDQVLGDRYIVTFSITFTTTDDWAALGNTASIGLKCSNSTSASLENGEMYMNSAERYKNKYYIPYVMNTAGSVNTTWAGISAGQIFYGSYIHVDFTGITDSTDGAAITIYDNNIHTLVNSDPRYTITYTYGWQLKDLMNDTETSIGDALDLYLSAGSCIVFNKSFISDNAIQIKNDNLYLCNPSSYSMYPNLLLDNEGSTAGLAFSLHDNNKDLVYIQQQTTDMRAININGRAGMGFDQNIPLMAATDLGGQRIYSAPLTVEKLAIPSGRPETIKGTICRHDDGAVDGQVSDAYNGIFKIKLEHAPVIPNRYHDFVISVYRTPTDISNVYSDDAYNAGDYSNTTFEPIIILNPVLLFDEDTKILTIYGRPNIYPFGRDTESEQVMGSILSVLANTTVGSTWNEVYISLCDTNGYSYTSNSGTHAIIDMQTRDVI